MKTASYSLRIDPEIKRKAEETFAVFGLNLSEAITVFLHTSILRRGFPFELVERTPSEMLLEAMEETEQMMREYADGTRVPRHFANAAEMFAAMDAEDEAEGLL